LLRVS